MKAKDLKNSILQLAIQGKLVPQDPKDEPASKLLEKIRAAKQKLVKEGKIKKDKQESFIYKGDDNNYYEKIGTEVRNITGEIPFEIPEGWVWVRLGSLFSHNTGKALNAKEREGKLLQYITTSNLYWGEFLLDNLKSMYFKESEIAKCTVTQGDLLVCEGGDIGRAAIWNYPFDMRIQNHIHRLRPYISLCLNFYCYVFFYYKYSHRIGGKGIAIQGLSSNAIHQLLIPLAPLREQERIVKRLETLEPYLDEYDNIASELTALNESFPEQIKKSILQYAIQGKLVPQDPNDEPASVLLEKIKAEKQKLIKAGKIKKDKVESYIYKRDNRHYEKIGDKEVDITDEIPFEIPDNWAWTRLGNLVQVLSDGTHKTPQYVANGVPFLSVQNISSGKFDFTKLKYITQEEHSKLIQRVKPTYNDILFCRIGTLGKAIKCTLDFEFSIFVSLGLIRLVNFSMNDYMIILLNSPFGDRWIQENKVGGGTHTFKLNLVDIPHMLLPIPPLAEQDRIVAKVEKLLKLLPSND